MIWKQPLPACPGNRNHFTELPAQPSPQDVTYPYTWLPPPPDIKDVSLPSLCTHVVGTATTSLLSWASACAEPPLLAGWTGWLTSGRGCRSYSTACLHSGLIPTTPTHHTAHSPTACLHSGLIPTTPTHRTAHSPTACLHSGLIPTTPTHRTTHSPSLTARA